MAASGAAAHDVYGTVLRRGKATDRQEIVAGRIAVAVIGAVGAVLALVAGKTFNVQLLVGLTFAVAASANFPVLVLALTWRRFNSLGVVLGITFGLVSSILLIILGPMVWSPKTAAPFPLGNPAIVSIPLGFLGCVLGTWLGRREKLGIDSFDEVRVRSTTGLGAEKASRRARAPRERPVREPVGSAAR
jgi:cation/acetate symporter